MEIIYGTGNQAKIAYMKRALEGLPLHITGLAQAAAAKGVSLPQVEETGMTPLENARLKAECYFKIFGTPVFSCDSGLYLWNHETGKALPREEQPGVCVRGRGEARLSDEELLSHYIGLVRKYGQIRARYKNGVCLIWGEEIRGRVWRRICGGRISFLQTFPIPGGWKAFPWTVFLSTKKAKNIFMTWKKTNRMILYHRAGFVVFSGVF